MSKRFGPLAQGLSESSVEANLNLWSGADSNRRPLACHASALPTELPPHDRFTLGLFQPTRPLVALQ